MICSRFNMLTRFSTFTFLIVLFTFFIHRVAMAQRVDRIIPSDHSIAQKSMVNIRPSIDLDMFDFHLDQTNRNHLQQESTTPVLSATTSYQEMSKYYQLFSQTTSVQNDGLSNAPPPITNFQGIVDIFTIIPPDTNGAVGPNHVVELLNVGFQVYSKTGTSFAPLISLQSFWSSLGTGAGQPASSLFDPKILYDQYEDRWVVVTDGADGINAWILVGISLTDDPTGSWNLFAIQANINDGAGNNHITHFADFPGFGLDPNNLVITNNIFTTSGSFVHADAWVINKSSLIAGGTLIQGVDYALFHDPGNTFGLAGFTFQPTHTFGQTSVSAVNYLVDEGWTSTTDSSLRFIRLQDIVGVGAGASLNTTGWFQVTGYNFSKLDATQPNCSVRINTNDTRILNAVVRNEKVWTTHGVGVGVVPTTAAPTRAEIAWYEFDPAVAAPFPGGAPNQMGKISDSSLYFYFPSIAVNKNECVAVGFSGSDSSTFASAYYTLRTPTQAPGVMQPIQLLKSGEGTYNKDFGVPGRNRWGDYSGTVIDPVDDETFWTVQEYARNSPTTSCPANSGVWGTWWGAFECSCNIAQAALPDPSGLDKSRYISFIPDNTGTMTAIRVTLINMNGFPSFNSKIRWVGAPFTFPEGSSSATFVGAELQCVPHFQDWSSIGLLHVYGREVVPFSTYDVQNIDVDCQNDLTNNALYSPSLMINTSRWGDVIAPFNPPSISTQPTIADVLSVVDKWLGSLNPIKAHAQLQLNLVNPNLSVGIADVLRDVDAWLGSPYPFSGPISCP